MARSSAAQESAPVAERPKPMGEARRAATEFLRVARNDAGEPVRLETSIVSYAPAGGKGELIVDLVGVIHVGDASYYEELNKAFEKYDVVLYELVAPEDARVPKRGGREAGGPIGLLQTMTRSVLKLESQTEHIDYTKDNFVHADLSPDEMKAAMKKRGEDGLTLALSITADLLRQANAAQQQAEGKAAAEEREAEDPLRMLLDPARSVKLRRMMAESFADADRLDGALGPTLHRILVEDRNAAAMKVFQKELAKGHTRIAIFYGAAHMPDFERRLMVDFGLAPKETRWLTAWDIPSAKPSPVDPLELLRKALQDRLR